MSGTGDTPTGDPGDLPLNWRRPAWLWGGLTWLVLGPLNPVQGVLFSLYPADPSQWLAKLWLTFVVIGIPATALASLGLYLVSRRPITSERLLDLSGGLGLVAPICVWTYWNILLAVTGLNTDSCGNPPPLTDALIFWAKGAFLSALAGPLATLPAAGLAVVLVRNVAFVRREPPAPATPSQMAGADTL